MANSFLDAVNNAISQVSGGSASTGLDVSNYNPRTGEFAGNPNISGENRDEYGNAQTFNEYVNKPDGSVKVNTYDASGNFTGSKNYGSLITNNGGFLSGGFFGNNSLFGTLAPIAAAAYGANQLGLFGAPEATTGTGVVTSPVYSPTVTGTTLGELGAAAAPVAASPYAFQGTTAGLTAAPGAGLELASTGGNLASMGGGQGLLNTGIGALEGMGLGAGLTAAAAGGGTLTGGGVVNPADLIGAAGLGASLANLNTNVGSLPGATTLGTGGTYLTNPGAGSTQSGGSTAGTGGPSLIDTLTGTPLGQGLTVGALGGLLQGYLGGDAASKAAQIQADATKNAIQQMTGVYNQASAQNAPYRGLGYQGVNTIGSLLPGAYTQYDASGNPVGTGAGSGYLTHQFNAADLAAGLAPNYDFMLQQGQMANQRAANVGGGLLGGNALQGLQKFTQDYAGNAYQNAFTNYQNQRNSIYQNLANIAGIGQTSQGQQNQLASDLAKTTAQMQVGNAAAQAAGTIGQANAYGNAIGQIGNAVTLAGLLGQRGNVAQTPVPTAANTVTNTANTIGNLANAGSKLFDYLA
jgi:hypothetical protein